MARDTAQISRGSWACWALAAAAAAQLAWCVLVLEPASPLAWLAGLAPLLALAVAAGALRSASREARQSQQQLEVLTYRNALLEESREAHTAELEVAVEMAEAASRAKSEFLANMSHEIRTPLNAVIGLTEVVLGTHLNEFQLDHLRTVLDSGESLLNVINDILDFSKIEAGKLELVREPLDVEGVFCDTLKALAVRAQGKGLELSCVIDPRVPPQILGDAGRLRQILNNLVGNAITYTERGDVFVKVEYEEEAGLLCCAVVDTGPGFEDDQLARLFQSFERGDQASTRRYGGTGLGLTIARQLAECMGGVLRGESEPGVGSSFHFSLKADLAELREEAPKRDSSQWNVLSGAPLLVVDDNATQREVYTSLGRRVGMQTAQASSAPAALAWLDERAEAGEELPLLLCDAQMPGEDGVWLAEAIRADPRLRKVEIVFLTSALIDSDHVRCEQLGIVARLMKPARQSEVLEALVSARLGQRPGQTPLGATGPAPVQGPDASGRRILLAEDSRANQKLALAILEREGHHVSVAENGRRAVEAFRSERFDLILMDIQMPELDGFGATAEIRAIEADDDRHTPIVAMTACALRGDRERCLAAGMDEYVSKPVRRAELLRVVGCIERFQHGAIDWSGAMNHVEGNEALLAEVVKAELSDLHACLERLPRLIAEHEWAEVQHRSHIIKSTMRMFGVSDAQEFAQRLESQARARQGEGAADLLVRLESSARDVVSELTHFVDTCSRKTRPGDARAPLRPMNGGGANRG